MVRERWIEYFLLLHRGEIAIRRRDSRRGIWKGLYELPGEVLEREPTALPTPPDGWEIIETLPLKDHRLSHRLLHLRVHVCSTSGDADPTYPDGTEQIPLSDHETTAFPKPLRHFLDHYTGSNRLL